jgi:hypothetical protein
MAKNDRRKNAGICARERSQSGLAVSGRKPSPQALHFLRDEWIMPLHRNLGVFTARNMPLHKLFMQWQGSKEGYSKGRERSFHFGSRQHYICMISHLGPS